MLTTGPYVMVGRDDLVRLATEYLALLAEGVGVGDGLPADNSQPIADVRPSQAGSKGDGLSPRLIAVSDGEGPPPPTSPSTHHEWAIETCLVCVVAWDVNGDPPKCREPDHPHALAFTSDWNKPGQGVAS